MYIQKYIAFFPQQLHLQRFFLFLHISYFYIPKHPLTCVKFQVNVADGKLNIRRISTIKAAYKPLRLYASHTYV